MMITEIVISSTFFRTVEQVKDQLDMICYWSEMIAINQGDVERDQD